MKLIIGADLVPTDTNLDLFVEGNRNMLIGNELEKILSNVDFLCFNLEVPITDVVAPIAKLGPSLRAPSNTIAGLKSINPYFFTLANNHILDQGEQGLEQTMNILRNNGIAFAGAGRNAKQAAQPYIFEKNGTKIGIYCCAEHEFSIAGFDSPGANAFDPLETFDHIQELKKECNYVIVLYHGGREHYRYPSPYLQRVCRKFVEKGADLIVCQHSHCIGCEELWNNGRIIYGQGNFLFDHSNNEAWKTSLLIEVDFDEKISIKYYPLVKKENTVRIANDVEAHEIVEGFEKRSNSIMEEGYVEKQFKLLADALLDNYLCAISGKSSKQVWFKAMYKLFKDKFRHYYSMKKYDGNAKLVLQNYLECEAHREMILTGLKGEEQDA